MRNEYLPFIAVVVLHIAFVCGIEFLERHSGESVVFKCITSQKDSPLVGLYLRRKSFSTEEHVVFMLSKTEPSFYNPNDIKRVTVTGDPSEGLVEVNISNLTLTDTDRYYCQFYVRKPGSTTTILGQTEYFLHVSTDGLGLVDLSHVEACAGGSVVLPCLSLHGQGSAVEGVALKRQKSQASVEMLYNSKHHHAVFSTPSSAGLHSQRLLLSTVLSPSGMTYNLTLLHLQPEDSAFYSCQLLLPGRPVSGTSLGRHVVYVSVKGGQCNCSSYITLLYALSSALAVILITLIGLLAIYQCKGRDHGKPQPQAPIYEEMVGVRPLASKKAPCHLGNLHLGESDTSAYSNTPRKACLENHYETTALCDTFTNKDEVMN